MSSGSRRISNIRIYVIQYAIFIFGAILAIAGLYMIDIDGLATAGFILLSLGAVFVVLSYVFARYGARVIGTNCPMCYGLGYIDKGKGQREICTVCEGSGKMYSKAQQHLMQEKRRQELRKEETSQKIENNENNE